MTPGTDDGGGDGDREGAATGPSPWGEGSSINFAEAAASRSFEPPGAGDRSAWVAAGLDLALSARVPGIHATTPMVRQLAVSVCRQLGLGAEDEARVDVAARVRDVGMLALPDTVVLATGALSPEDWAKLNRHPAIGANLLQRIASVAFAQPVVRAHHERWDGEGYPDGLRGERIPMLSRVIAVCDGFVAMAMDRPHRRGMGAEAALERVRRESGAQFDPRCVRALEAVLTAVSAQTNRTRGSGSRSAPSRGRVSPQTPRADPRSRNLPRAVAEFDVVPALGPAYERALTLAAGGATAQGELVAALEGDTGLTLAVLRHVQAVHGPGQIANVSDAVELLGPDGIVAAITPLPRAAFPWRTPFEALLHSSRVHAQAVARAAERISREVALTRDDEVLIAALLHDVGKLVIGRARPELASASGERTATPEDRVHQERAAFGMDHASLGGLLLRKWELPGPLVNAVAEHHSAESKAEVATLVRLADMIAHHAQGEAVDRRLMLRLASACGLSARTLRDVIFDLPHAGGSRRRRADPSPLTPRETAALRLLGEGKVYKVIAQDLGLSHSTVRSHLHNVYRKLGVSDRAQAVLRATELGWL